MKFFFALIMTSFVSASWALSFYDVASVEYPAGLEEGNPVARVIKASSDEAVAEYKTEYFPNGKTNLSVRYLQAISKKQIKEMAECGVQLLKVDFEARAPQYCADDVGTHYVGIHGVKRFASRFCGELQVVPVPCAKQLVKFLDDVSNAHPAN